MSGVQLGSGSERMAVTGRQKWYVYLDSQQAIAKSPAAKSSRANRRAFSTRVVPWETATAWAMSFQMDICVALGTAIPCQKMAASVSSAVRAVLSTEPSSRVRFRAAAYSGLSSAGGGGTRNCEALWRQKGVT